MTRRLLALLTALVVAAVGCTGGDDVPAERIPGVRAGLAITPPTEREPAPDVAMPVLGADGETLAISDLAGQVVVLNFWASWCGPCRAEQPELNAAAETVSGEPVTFLGVNIQDEVANALAHEREFDIPYDSIFDPDNAYAARFGGVGPRSIPTTILVDREGRVAVRLFGTTTTLELLALTERLLDEAA